MVQEGKSGREPRIFFVPFFATGHLIPMVDAARLFASRDMEATMVVTPANADVIRRTLERANAKGGRQIKLLLYPFPSKEVGLPEGHENLSSVPSSESTSIADRFDRAALHVRDSLSQILRENRPDCIISDIHFYWTTELAKELEIPRLTFNAIGVFSACVMNSIVFHRPFMHVASDGEPFIVPDLPHPIEMVRHEVPEGIRSTADFTQLDHFWKHAMQAQKESYGVLVNTFSELDPAYTHLYEKTIHEKTWYVGPLALSYDDEDNAGKIARGGGGGGGNYEKCMSWLETKSPGSVVFLCFGSWCHFSKEQLREMALGLEASGHAFLWVVREEEDGGPELLPEGFEGRVEGKGLVVRWAPQVVVLNHPAVGAFVTHCGWNSLLEGVCAGVPMVTWPLFIDQFIHEKLVVQVLRIGVQMTRVVSEEGEISVKGEDIARVVAGVMDGGEEVEAMRRRARECGEMARLAVKEGGSSCNDLNRLIDDLKMWRHQKEG